MKRFLLALPESAVITLILGVLIGSIFMPGCNKCNQADNKVKKNQSAATSTAPQDAAAEPKINLETCEGEFTVASDDNAVSEHFWDPKNHRSLFAKSFRGISCYNLDSENKLTAVLTTDDEYYLFNYQTGKKVSPPFDSLLIQPGHVVIASNENYEYPAGGGRGKKQISRLLFIRNGKIILGPAYDDIQACDYDYEGPFMATSGNDVFFISRQTGLPLTSQKYEKILPDCVSSGLAKVTTHTGRVSWISCKTGRPAANP